MINSIRNFAYNTYESLPRLKLDTASNIVKKMTKIAIPVIVLVGTQQALAADGAWLYCLCLAACSPLAEAPPLLALCIAACTPLLPLP